MAMVMKVEASSLALMQLLSGNSHNIEGYNCDTSNHSPFSALTARETYFSTSHGTQGRKWTTTSGQ